MPRRLTALGGLLVLAGCVDDFPAFRMAPGDGGPFADARAEADGDPEPVDRGGPLDRGVPADATPPDAAACSPETCNGQDEDCDGRIDEGAYRPCWPFDPALRGRGRCMDGRESCVDGRWTGDCTAAIGPVDELCNGVDEDCDGVADPVGRPCYGGPEGTQGVGQCAAGLERCAGGVWSGRCEGAVGPAAESCDTTDEDCDGRPDEGLDACSPDPDDDGVFADDNCPLVANLDQLDADADGRGDACDDDDDGDGVADADDCQPLDPTRFPGADEVCDGADDDCDGATDEVVAPCYPGPPEAIGVGVCLAGTAACAGGAVGACEGAVLPGEEACNGLDDDCDGRIDEGLVPGWPDQDADGFGNAAVAPTCPALPGQALQGGDCDDRDADVNPAALDRLGEAGRDVDCDGVDGERERLVFVAPDGNDDEADGSPERPFGTLPAAIHRATEVPNLQGVIVGTGVYPGPVRLAPGVHLYGGYARARGWDVHGTSEIHAEGAAADPIALHAEDIAVPTVVTRLRLTTADNPTPGGSTYGLLAIRAPALRLEEVDIEAGAGGPGRAGAPGAPGAGGARGGDGGDCGGDPGAGGPSACGPGGDGGRGARGDNPGDPGQPAGCGGPGGGGAGTFTGGDGGDGCSPPADASPGAPGQPGFSGAVLGDRWQPGQGSAGERGTDGRPGGGGGGGGGAGWIDRRAGAGGGGGGAGCGGGGGGGGAAGGGSFAVFAVDSTGLIIRGGELTAGAGGSGGPGAAGGPGGGGGPGGDRGAGRDWLSCGGIGGPGWGGRGGQGSPGAAGGHGAGGDGGTTAAIWCTRTFLAPVETRLRPGPAGDPGEGPGLLGAPGRSFITFGCDAP